LAASNSSSSGGAVSSGSALGSVNVGGSAAAVPELSTLVLLGLGSIGFLLAGLRCGKRRG
jgi:hypothetical protein